MKHMATAACFLGRRGCTGLVKEMSSKEITDERACERNDKCILVIHQT